MSLCVLCALPVGVCSDSCLCLNVWHRFDFNHSKIIVFLINEYKDYTHDFPQCTYKMCNVSQSIMDMQYSISFMCIT